MVDLASSSRDGVVAGMLAKGLLGLRLQTLIPLALVAYVLYAIYGVLWGPMSQFPGPIWNKISGIPHAYAQCRGRETDSLPALHARYGPVVQIAPRELSVASGARGWKEIYGFKRPGQPRLAKDPIMYLTPVIEADHINSIGDAAHARHGRILSHAFSDAALREQEPLMRSWAAAMRRWLDDRLGAAEAPMTVDLNRLLQCVSFDLMADLTFGESLGMLDRGRFNPWIESLVQGVRLDGWLRILRHFAVGRLLANTLLSTQVARRKHWEHMRYCMDRVDRRLPRTSPDRPDFWSRILANSEKHGCELTLEEHYVTATIFMLAGPETTSTWLSGTLHMLLTHPDWMQKVKDEVRSAFSTVQDMTLERLTSLARMNACLQETMRIYPPVPCAILRRTPAGGAPIADFWVPGDVTVGVHAYATNTSPALFKDPCEFHPERWLGDPEYAGDELDAVEPFSIGPRNCLGRYLAWHEGHLLLATFVLHFDIELTPQSEAWMRDQLVYTLWQKGPMPCRVQRAGSA